MTDLDNNSDNDKQIDLATHAWHFDAPTESKVRGAVAIARDRLLATMVVFALGFLLVFGKLVDATVIAGGNSGEPKPEIAATAPNAANGRADIIDRNGEVLATSLPTVSLYADAVRVIEPERTADKLLEAFPDLDRARLLADLSSKKRFVWVKRHLTPQQYAAAIKLGLPGLEFQREFRRVYPQGALFSHELGYLGIDQTGLAGLEKTEDERLRQNPATPLRLSVDARLQHILKRELQAQMDTFTAAGGAGMIMDVHTGEILAIASLPDFDPHEPGEATPDQLFNRATLGVYEMGSTFKIFNTALGLDSGKVKLTDKFDTVHPIKIGRFTITDYHPANHWYDVPEIMQESSNIGSVHIFEQVGVDAQKAFLAKLGLTKQAKLEVPERGEPMVPNPWRDVNGMTIAFGHGIAVSPLHLVRAVSAIVNGGTTVDPTLLKRQPGDVTVGERVISEQTSTTMRSLMRLVVTNGTAKMAEAPGYYIGGKTGTADKLQNGHYLHNARMSSFVGAFPMNDPRYVVYLLIDDPKGNAKSYGFATGGWVAAPAVGRIVSQMAPLLGIAPQNVLEPAPPSKTPPVSDDEEPAMTEPAEPAEPTPPTAPAAPGNDDDEDYGSPLQPVLYIPDERSLLHY